MQENDPFDFWYGVGNTKVIRLPSRTLETFGNTVVDYHFLSEIMDEVGKVRIREGRIHAYKPQIVTPDHFGGTPLEGFGEEAEQYADWLRAHEKDFFVLQYGYIVKKTETNEHIVSEGLDTVMERVKSELEAKDDPLSALVVGMDDLWEVCLLKLMVDMTQKAAPDHFKQLRSDPHGARHDIEQTFRAASRDPGMIPALSSKLQEHELFAEYEDRFFELVRSYR